MTERYDAIIVGARVAGAGLAIRLARSGRRVLLLDSDALPSDMIMSTHFIHRRGVAALDELGVLDQVREIAPPASVVRIQVEDANVDMKLAEPYPIYAPRRSVLDSILQEAAVEAGAELRDRSKAVEVLWDGERASGVRVERGGSQESVYADVVIGADGRHSPMAKMLGAEEYKAYDAPRGAYWAYWPRPDWFGTECGSPFDMCMRLDGDRIRYIFRTDGDLVILATTAPMPVYEEWRKEHHAAYLEDISADPLLAPLMEGAEPVTQVRGAYRERFGFRQGAGPGWALLGDAGNVKDYTLGHGMSDALLHGRMLAEAIQEGTDQALERYWRKRDVHALPLFRFAEDWGEGDSVTELERAIYAHVARSPELTQRLVAVNDRELDPYQAFTTGEIFRWTMGAALRGKLGVLPQFLAMGRRASNVAREVEERQQLLDAVESAAPGSTAGHT